MSPSRAEPLLAFAAVTAIASALYWAGQVVPLVGRHLHGGIAVLFLYAPAVAARLSRQPFDYRSAGLRVTPVGWTLGTTALAVACTWPVFIAGFFVFYGGVCAAGGPPALTSLGESLGLPCGRWLGLDGGVLRLPPDLLLLAASQVVVIAIPEELFFRGYLHTRLEALWPSRRLLLGAPVGPALFVGSVLFGLGHVLVDLDPQRMAVAVPGLVFGWMRARSGSIAAGALFHALCNLLSDTMHGSFWRAGP